MPVRDPFETLKYHYRERNVHLWKITVGKSSADFFILNFRCARAFCNEAFVRNHTAHLALLKAMLSRP